MLTHRQENKLSLLVARASYSQHDPNVRALSAIKHQEMRTLLRAETFGKRYSGLNDCDLAVGQHIDLEV